MNAINPSPRSFVEIEKVLIGIWEKTFASFIDGDSNFHRLGGNSINSCEIIMHSKNYGLNFSREDIYNNQTIKGLASFLCS